MKKIIYQDLRSSMKDIPKMGVCGVRSAPHTPIFGLSLRKCVSPIYIALGTNLGDRVMNLQTARDALPPTVRLMAASPVYETPPWGVSDQPAFLNQVIHVETELSPLGLLDYLKDLEIRLGREPSIRYGPRKIDLDILFYGQQVLADENLTIPHARLHERAFVLVPLADLAPEFRHPRLGENVHEMLAKIDTTGVKKI